MADRFLRIPLLAALASWTGATAAATVLPQPGGWGGVPPAEHDSYAAGVGVAAIAALFGLIAWRRLAKRVRDAERCARDARAAQREAVAMVAHEFRAPLAVIDAAAQTLALDVCDEAAPDARRRIDKIRRAAGRLAALVDACLGDERLAAGEAPPRREAVDLRRLLEAAAEEWRASGAAVRLALPADGAPVVARCDETLISIALSNLIDNAVKYAAAGGEIVLALARTGDQAVLSVADRGPGIAAADLGRVFDRFWRARAAAGVPGAGLGLHLVRQIARRHGGDAQAESAPGQGAVFRLVLPCEAA